MRFIDGISESVGKIISFAVVLMMLFVLWEAVSREVFLPTVWAHQLVAFLFGVYVMLSGVYTLRHKGHIRIDILLNRLPRRKQAILRLFTSVFFFVFLMVVLYYGAQIAWDSFQHREFTYSAWAPPLYPYKIANTLAVLLMLLQGVVEFVRDLMVAISERDMA